MSINGVFFDLYGTLLIYNDMHDVWSDFLSEFYVCLQDYGLSIPEETFTARCERFFDKDEPPRREDGLTIFERRIQAMCSELEVNIEVADIKYIATTIVNAIQRRHYLDPDCYPVLEALGQHKTLVLISNYDHPPHIYTLLDQLGLRKFFTAIFVSGDIGTKKPDPTIFHLALERIGLQPEEVVHVGDAEEDISGALAAGIAPILIRRDLSAPVSPAYEYRTDQRIMEIEPNESSITGVRMITSLPELIEILG